MSVAAWGRGKKVFLCIWDNGFRERKPTRNKEHPDRIQIAFDDHRLVNNPGLLLPATLAQRVGLRELVDHYLDLGDAPGRATASVSAFVLQEAGRLPVFPFIHVEREAEVDYRTLYSRYISEAIQEGMTIVSFPDFRDEASAVLERSL